MKTKLLLVEDDGNARQAIASYFESVGYEVRSADSCRQAIRTGLEFDPDCLLSDWHLDGGLDGVELAKLLRILYPRIRIVLMTAYGVEELRRCSENLSVRAFVEKPISLERLQEIVAASV